MVAQYDDKGKIFTQVIAKKPVEVSIQTEHQFIKGTIYIRPGMRILDELNGEDRFLAVTDAIITTDDNQEAYKSSFLVVSVGHIVWIIPEEE